MVMSEIADKPRETFILGRGDYRNQTKGNARRPGGSAAAADRRAGESADARAMAGGSGESADRSRRREPLLADVLRHGHREDRRELRLAGRTAQPSRAARLAGDGIHSHRLGRESDAAADRHLRDLPAVFARNAGTAGARSGEPAACARSAFPPAGRDDPRRRAFT